MMGAFEDFLILIAILGCGLIAISLFISFFFIRVWIRAYSNGIKLEIIDIVGMRTRGSPAMKIVDSMIILKEKDVDATVTEVEKVCRTRRGERISADELADLVISKKKTAMKS